ncbi:MAG: WD40/YVTN/BNR-like repeat-containing protein [Candidatus Humimicrobiaceae bacterium]
MSKRIRIDKDGTILREETPPVPPPVDNLDNINAPKNSSILKKNVAIAILAVVLVVVCIIFIAYGVSRQKERLNEANIFLEKQNSAIEEKQKDKAIAENWVQVGLPAETISDLIIADTNTLYAATIGFNHGIFKSDDGGNTWNAINNGLGSLEVYDIDIFTNDYNRVVAGTEKGLWFTQDGGKHWQPLGPTNNQNLSIISVSVLEPSTIIAVGPANYGAFISYDNGVNWQGVDYVDASGDYIFWNVSLWETHSVSEPTPIIYLIGYSNIYRSSDGGKSWSQRANVGANYNVYSFAVDQKNGNTSYAVAGYYHGYCVYKSTDGGDSWIPINNGLPDLSNESDDIDLDVNRINVNKNNSNNVYFAIAGKVYKSNDGGESWSQLQNLPSELGLIHIYALEFDNKKSILYIGTYQNGIWCISIAN